MKEETIYRVWDPSIKRYISGYTNDNDCFRTIGGCKRFLNRHIRMWRHRYEELPDYQICKFVCNDHESWREFTDDVK